MVRMSCNRALYPAALLLLQRPSAERRDEQQQRVCKTPTPPIPESWAVAALELTSSRRVDRAGWDKDISRSTEVPSAH